MDNSIMKRIGSVLLLATFVLTGCSGYSERVSPIELPSASANRVEVNGAQISATVYLDKDVASSVFGFDVRGAGLIPVRLVIDNQSESPLRLIPQQTFLIDAQDRAWPILEAEAAAERVRAHVDVAETVKGTTKPALLLGGAGALAGFAIGVVTGEDIGSSVAKGAAVGASSGAIVGGAKNYAEIEGRVRQDMRDKSLENRQVASGDLAYGYLFFPGDNEAQSAQGVRLTFELGAERHVRNIILNQGRIKGVGDN
ncbi:MAG: hypothetical protein CMN57_05300 [Gammaproteobacteria bacterium]|nr:hypothetical protein [Gammaproteobacteria bacterium]